MDQAQPRAQTAQLGCTPSRLGAVMVCVTLELTPRLGRRPLPTAKTVPADSMMMISARTLPADRVLPEVLAQTL